jgi:type II secretory pathway pseudopilin PulG
MMKLSNKNRSRKVRNGQAGLTLIETVIALGILLVAAAGVMGLATIALCTTENQGHLMARTAEYAQDKMEQLLALSYCDSDSDTTVMPTVKGTGQGLAGCPSPPASAATGSGGVGGSSSPSAPVAGYVDYLDANGNLVAAGSNWEYIRVWKVELLSPAGAPNTLKRITVTAKVKAGAGGSAVMPKSTVTALKTYPF